MTLAPTNPMRSAVMSVLVFEIIVIWLAYIGMIQVAGVNLAIAAVVCAIVSLVCLAAAAGLRKRWGYFVGWIAQVLLIATGVLTPWMYAMGIIFALIWVACIILGRRIETNKVEGASQ